MTGVRVKSGKENSHIRKIGTCRGNGYLADVEIVDLYIPFGCLRAGRMVIWVTSVISLRRGGPDARKNRTPLLATRATMPAGLVAAPEGVQNWSWPGNDGTLGPANQGARPLPDGLKSRVGPAGELLRKGRQPAGPVE
jgi:hypothetical protein